MTRLQLRPHQQQALLAPCTASAPAERPRGVDPARTPLPLGAPARSHAALAELHAADHPARDRHAYNPDRLLPRSAQVRRVTPARVVLDDIDTVTADVLATIQARPELRHDTAVLMALAPVVAMLKGVEL